MQQIGDWLEKLGVTEYAQSFAENDVDWSVLPYLTDEDLKELGVSLGHRRKMLASIAALTKTPLSGPDPEPERKVEESAERRQVTVLFCDLVGSTALSSTVDPEVLSVLIRRYQDACAGVISRFGGFVAKFMGDGVLAYFGFPRAFEDAAERAVRAALAIGKEISCIEDPRGVALQTRIGIATGLVVVGEIVGVGTAQERTIVGETPNLAARLQALADPDTILIGETTRNLLGALFDLEKTGEHALKGFARPVPAWRVQREATDESRFTATRAGRRLPLVGRANERGLLLDRWRLAKSGEGQIVTLVGEAGIGKSHLVFAFQDALAGEPHTRIQLQCSPYYSDSALSPVIKHLSRAARFAAEDSPGAKIDKLSALFARRAVSDPLALPLLADLLSIAEMSQQVPASLNPAQRKARLLALLADEIVACGENEPALLILEDAHWVDATTLELITRLVNSISETRLLVLVTARPDFTPPWQTRPHSTLLTLGRLGRADCAELVAGIAVEHSLLPETVATIIARTDGVPLFVEELTRSVMELAGEDSVAVPATLKDSLMARLDRLDEAREVAQIAAVIGRQFPFSILEAVVPKTGAALEAALDSLVVADILLPEGRGLDRGFSFKHALLRDAAYESLLLARRREWHERTARTVEQRFPEVAANEPEIQAYHFSEAGLVDPACAYRMRAGDRAVMRSAYKEAVAHFSTGLKLAETLPQSSERLRTQLDFLVKLVPAIMVAHGMGSADAENACRRAADIAEALDDGPAVYKAKWGLWLNANIRRKTTLARDRANELVTLAQRSGDDDQLLEAYHCRWSTALFRGDVTATRDNSRIGLESYDMMRHRHLGPAFGGHDPGVCAHACQALALEQFGEREQAQLSALAATALAEELDHSNSLGHAFQNVAIASQLAGDREATLAAACRASELSEKFGLLPWRAGSLLLAGWATAVGPSGIADAVRVVEAEIQNATATGPLPQYFLGVAAEILLAAGRPADALAHLDRAIAGIDEPGVGFYLPEIHRFRGECLLAVDRNNKDAARQDFLAARDIASRQGALIFERRAKTRLVEIDP
jgi:class 3 adenylate cyclase/tetratricopeptide (TPR) repeat protein